MASSGGRGGVSLGHGDPKGQRGLSPLSQLHRLPGGVPGNHVPGRRHHHHQPPKHYAGNRQADRRFQAPPRLHHPSLAPQTHSGSTLSANHSHRHLHSSTPSRRQNCSHAPRHGPEGTPASAREGARGTG